MDKDLERCNCGRDYCQFFNGSEGERGASYDIDELKDWLKKQPEIICHIEKLVEDFEAEPNGQKRT